MQVNNYTTPESEIEIAEYVQDLIDIGRNLAQIKEAIARYFTNVKWNAHFMDVWIKNMEAS